MDVLWNPYFVRLIRGIAAFVERGNSITVCLTLHFHKAFLLGLVSQYSLLLHFLASFIKVMEGKCGGEVEIDDALLEIRVGKLHEMSII